MTYQHLISETRGPVGWIILNRPQLLNALCTELAEEAISLSEVRLNLGTGTLLELNASQLDLINARYGSVQALFNLKIARAALDFAMGRLER